MYRIMSLCLIAVIVILTACGKVEVVEEKEDRQFALSDLDPLVVDASNSFGLKLFHEVSKANPDQNSFISPISVSSVLAMAYNGAEGETADEMGQVLGLDLMTKEKSRYGYRVALDLLTHPEDVGVKLELANSLWLRRGEKFHEDFVQQSKDDYQTEVNELIFNSPNAARTINKWVNKKTHQKIPSIVDNLPPQTVLYLLNAVYYEGEWTEPFSTASTTVGQFHLNASEAVKVRMMAKGGEYEYAHTDGYQVISLPFGKEGSASMVVMLPDEGVALSDLQKKLIAEPLRVTGEFEKHMGRIELPRVNIEFDAGLKESLQAIGMSVAFDPENADFANMVPTPPEIFINNVKHKTFLQITEQGTIAAAVSSIDMPASEPAPDHPFHMIVDRPFLLAIVDRDTDCILFVGTIMNPNG